MHAAPPSGLTPCGTSRAADARARADAEASPPWTILGGPNGGNRRRSGERPELNLVGAETPTHERPRLVAVERRGRRAINRAGPIIWSWPASAGRGFWTRTITCRLSLERTMKPIAPAPTCALPEAGAESSNSIIAKRPCPCNRFFAGATKHGAGASCGGSLRADHSSTESGRGLLVEPFQGGDVPLDVLDHRAVNRNGSLNQGHVKLIALRRCRFAA